MLRKEMVQINDIMLNRTIQGNNKEYTSTVFCIWIGKKSAWTKILPKVELKLYNIKPTSQEGFTPCKQPIVQGKVKYFYFCKLRKKIKQNLRY